MNKPKLELLAAITMSGLFALQAHAEPPVIEPVEVAVTNTPIVEVLETSIPYQERFTANYSSPNDSTWRVETEPVDPGQTLVIEYISIEYTPIGTAATSAPPCRLWILSEPNCNDIFGKVTMEHSIPLSASRSFFPDTDDLVLSAATPVLAYAHEGQVACLRCELPSDFEATCIGCARVGLSGRLIPAYH